MVYVNDCSDEAEAEAARGLYCTVTVSPLLSVMVRPWRWQVSHSAVSSGDMLWNSQRSLPGAVGDGASPVGSSESMFLVEGCRLTGGLGGPSFAPFSAASCFLPGCFF